MRKMCIRDRARPESDLTLEALAERIARLEAQIASGVPSAPMSAAVSYTHLDVYKRQVHVDAANAARSLIDIDRPDRGVAALAAHQPHARLHDLSLIHI